MSTTQTHQRNLASVSDRKDSPAIWGDCPWDDIGDPRSTLDGVRFYEDFTAFKTSTNVNAAEAYWCNGLKLFGDNGAVVTALDAQGGGITIGSDGDNEGASFGTMTYPFRISRSHKKLWWECRFKTSTIADTKHGIFMGLIDSSALSATVPIAAAGTLADQNFVGFHRLEGDGDMLDLVYKANGVTQVTVLADAVTLVADTFINVGFKWDPDDAYKLKFYQNNQLISTTYTMASAAGTDFGNDVQLGIVFAVLNATGSSPGTTSIAHIRAAQLI